MLALHIADIGSKTHRGKFQIKRKFRRDRMRAKLQAVKQELRRSMHQPIPKQGRWLQRVVTGYFNYHAVPTNRPTLTAFLFHVTNLWRRTLWQRSQKDWTTWERTKRLGRRLAPATANPSSVARKALRRQTPKVGAVCPNWARTDLYGGGAR
jgi:RNA-directed DNA polymerase